MTYITKPFFESCLDRYDDLVFELTGNKPVMMHVDTPFLIEDHKESTARAIVDPNGDTVYCPWCKHAFPVQGNTSDAKRENRAMKKKEKAR